MENESQQLAFDLTFLFAKDDDQWTGLVCEIDVASCGDTIDEVREGLKEASELFVLDVLTEEGPEAVARPVPQADFQEFIQQAGASLRAERHIMLVDLDKVVHFLPSSLPISACQFGKISTRMASAL